MSNLCSADAFIELSHNGPNATQVSLQWFFSFSHQKTCRLVVFKLIDTYQWSVVGRLGWVSLNNLGPHIQ